MEMYLFLFKLINVLTPIKIFLPSESKMCMEEMEISHPSRQEAPFSQEPFFEWPVIYGGRLKTKVVRLGEGEGANPSVELIYFTLFKEQRLRLGSERQR